MGTPGIMIRFRDLNHPAVELHNEIIGKAGKCYWGVWLKSFEDASDILYRAKELASSGATIYIADTESKAHPAIYIANVVGVFGPNEIDRDCVPEYYRDRIDRIPLWFEINATIHQIDADRNLAAILGVPTTYFLSYDEKGQITNKLPQRVYPLTAVDGARYVLHISDIHLGDDHGFRYPIEESSKYTGTTRTFRDVACTRFG